MDKEQDEDNEVNALVWRWFIFIWSLVVLELAQVVVPVVDPICDSRKVTGRKEEKNCTLKLAKEVARNSAVVQVDCHGTDPRETREQIEDALNLLDSMLHSAIGCRGKFRNAELEEEAGKGAEAADDNHARGEGRNG